MEFIFNNSFIHLIFASSGKIFLFSPCCSLFIYTFARFPFLIFDYLSQKKSRKNKWIKVHSKKASRSTLTLIDHLSDRCVQPWGNASTDGRSSTPSEPGWPRPCPSPPHLHGSASTASSSPPPFEWTGSAAHRVPPPRRGTPKDCLRWGWGGIRDQTSGGPLWGQGDEARDEGHCRGAVMRGQRINRWLWPSWDWICLTLGGEVKPHALWWNVSVPFLLAHFCLSCVGGSWEVLLLNWTQQTLEIKSPHCRN